MDGLVQIATPDEVTQAEMAEAQGKEQAVKDAFASDLYSRWQGYREARREVEDEWLDALRAVKGEYGPEQEKVMEEQQALSRVFIKITATKVNAAYSRLIDLLFQNVDSFWDIVPSPMADIPASIKQRIRMMAIQELLPYPLDPRTRNQLIQERFDEMQRSLMAEALGKRYSRQIEGKSKAEANRIIAEEYLAHLAEKDPKNGLLTKVVSMIRNALRRLFPNIKWTDADAVELLAAARGHLKRNGSLNPNGPKGNRYNDAGRAPTFYSAVERGAAAVKSDKRLF